MAKGEKKENEIAGIRENEYFDISCKNVLQQSFITTNGKTLYIRTQFFRLAPNRKYLRKLLLQID